MFIQEPFQIEVSLQGTDRPEFCKLRVKSRDLISLPYISEMVAYSETAWPSVMVKRGASALGETDGHGNCGHVMFHFQF